MEKVQYFHRDVPAEYGQHVIRQHLIEVVRATSSSHAFHGVVNRIVVPVSEPAFVELDRGFLALRISTGDCDPEGTEDLGEV